MTNVGNMKRNQKNWMKSGELDEIRRDKEHQKENENIRTALEDTGCSSG